MNTMQNRPYISGLDGLRAIAILFVVFYHISFSWARGGFLGVNIFFVLSGYLITSKILSSQDGFNVKAFWKGRIMRLLPSLYLVIGSTVIWAILFNPGLLKTLAGDALSSVSYTTNWWFIFHKLSYFDSFGSPSPLKHIWFLAVQEQFYILWPLILAAVLKFTKKTSSISIMITAGAFLSAALMALLYDPAADPSRVYYGTDTRAFELLTGSLLAVVLAGRKSFSEEASKKRKIGLKLTSIAAFSIFILSAVFIDEYNTFLYRGGFFLFSLNTALLIACICHPKGILGHVLSWGPLRWIGTRSYGIYLWHYPIIVLSTPVHEIGTPSYIRVFFQLAVTCIIAEFTYRFIELPIRKLGPGGYYNHLTASLLKRSPLRLAKRTAAIISVLVIMPLVIGFSSAAKIKSSLKKAEAHSSGTITVPVSESETPSEGFDETDISLPAKNGLILNRQNSPSSAKTYGSILAIGDSVMLDIAPSLNKKFNNITIDGKVGRQMSEAVSLAGRYAAFNTSDKAVIIELGTNGYFTNKQIDELLDSFSKSHVFLINTRVPRSWESKVNKMLKEKADERENVILIDWYSAASKHPEYFGKDGVHLTSKGAEALASLISKALNR